MSGGAANPGTTEPATGAAVVEGIAIGRAIVWASDPAPHRAAGTIEQERARLSRALMRAVTGIEELMRLLPRAEAELFEPEVAILAELGPILLARVDGGVRGEDAVNDAMAEAPTDLLSDARARLLDGLAYDERSVEALLEGHDGDRVLIAEKLTPSVVASLPARVVGIVAASEDGERAGNATSSHAAILARGRDIPLAFVSPSIVQPIATDDVVILDTTGSDASVWIAPPDAVVADAKKRREALLRVRTEEDAKVTEPLTHLGLEVRVNVGSLYEHVPPSVEGIGLLRTELVFSGRTSAPSEAEQFGALRALAGKLNGAPLVVRLFDAGGDKPLPWLRPPEVAPAARGIQLLLLHPALLDAQLRATARAAAGADVRVLLPFVTSPADVERVRARSKGALPVGAMVETPEAVDRIDEIAAASDFVCIGTNDLFALVSGVDRAIGTPSLDTRLLRMIDRVVAAAHARGRKVTVCGEMAGDPQGARILVGLGVDAISVSTRRLTKVKLSLRDVTLDDCRAVAQKALT